VTGSAEKITQRDRIAALLLQLRQSRISLNVTLPGTDQIFQSIILDVVLEDDAFLLDELAPRSGHDLFLESGQLHVKTRLKGSEIAFNAQLLEADIEDNVAFYRLALPTTLLYNQRRSAFRVHVGYDKQLPVQLIHDENSTVEGQLYNLSLGGFCVQAEQMAEWRLGTTVQQCIIDFDDGTHFECMAELRNIHEHDNGRSALFGFMFVELDRLQKSYIQKKVVRLEREHLRRNALTR
jgi:c-di-GMP-binding flagellar brake protein YcgR